MSKSTQASGRIETIVAVLVLGAVLALFAKFHGSEQTLQPPPPTSSAPAEAGTEVHPSTQQ